MSVSNGLLCLITLVYQAVLTMPHHNVLSVIFPTRINEQTCFYAYAKTKALISCMVTTQIISSFVFATYIVQYLYFLNPKFQVSSHLLWLYSFVLDLVGNPSFRFSREAPRICSASDCTYCIDLVLSISYQ